MTAATAPALAADLDAGLRGLKLGTMRRTAAELMVTAKTQRWSPEEFLRTLLDAEITSRDESNARARMKDDAFPVLKTIEEFDIAASSILQATFDYLASLEWIRAAENYCAVGPAGTGKSHSLVAFGVAAVEAGSKVRNFAAADLVETLYRGLADNSIGRIIEDLLRNDLVIMDEVGLHARRHRRAAAVPVRRRPPRTARPWHQLPLSPSTSGARPCPKEPATAVSLLDRFLHHAEVVIVAEGRIIPNAPGTDQETEEHLTTN